MQTSKWGPSAWTYLHSVTFNYPDTPTSLQKKNIKDLFQNLQYTLPCKYCRDSYTVFFKYIDIEPYLESRMGLTYWLYVIHNLVNLKLDKHLVPFSSVVKHYENLRAGKDNKDCNCGDDMASEPFYLEFAKKAEKKYRRITDDYIKRLISSNESPIDPKKWT